MSAPPYRLIIHPRWTKRGYRYDVEHDGETLVRASRDPEHDAARVLAARDIGGTAEAVDAANGVPRMRFDIERFAATCTVERSAGGLSTERWRPRPSEISAVRSQSGVSHPGGMETADEPEQASVAHRRRAA